LGFRRKIGLRNDFAETSQEDAMAKPQGRVTDQKETQERRNRPPAGKGARERLLAGLPVTERRLQLNGVSTAVLEGGDGPPVVLLHGPGEYGAKWLRVIPNLVTTHRVIAPDLPGHGTSEVIDGPLDVDGMLAWLDDLIECTCPTAPALVGHILGGAIAARFASNRRERLSRLVLVDALGLAAFQPTPDFGLALTTFISEPTEDTHDRLWSRCAFDFDAMRNRLGERWEWIKAYNLDRARTPGLPVAQHSLMEQFGMPAIPPVDLARIAVPTTLIWGRHDLATQLPIAQAASIRYGWPLHVIENAGDDPPMEQPEAFLEALRAALANSSGNAEVTTRKQDTRTAWDKIAPGYDRTNTPTQMWIANEGLRRASLRSSMRFLDVAAGSGALSIPAARLGAQVLATDQSPVMLELLGARARKEGLNIESRVLDGHALELEDNSFDMAGSQFGVMLFPNMTKGIREMVRVIKPGGRVLLHAYGDPHKIEFLDLLIGAVQSVRPAFNGPPMDPPPLEFQLADPDRMHEELSFAGLKDVKVETITETTEHKTGKDLWEWLVWSNPIVEMVLGGMLNLTNDERGVVQQTLEKMVRERAGGRGAAKLTNPVNIGIGTK
jgi:pimeloyl-ACP methyl ester carboxylesterase/ubiquinone/menaquinone biosynthesis C-methylase UbiE